MTIDDDGILQSYVEEAQEHLADIEKDLLAIEQAGADIDEDLVNRVFRAAHSLKGGAGFMGLDNIKELAHKIENVLGLIRSREMIPTPEIIDVLLLAFDKLQELISNVDQSNEIDISEHTEALTRLTTAALPEGEQDSVCKIVDIALPDGKVVFTLSEFDISQARKGGKYIYLVEYDLIRDVQDTGKTPLEVLTAMQQSGAILECKVDTLDVGGLEDDTFSDRLPFLVLFATIIAPDIIGALFEVDEQYIHLISEDVISEDVTIKPSTTGTPGTTPEVKEVPVQVESPEAGKEPEPKPEIQEDQPQKSPKPAATGMAGTGPEAKEAPVPVKSPEAREVVGLATFYVGDTLCGMDILKVQEINKHMKVTRVPQAPEYVLGVLNLRGRIVTIIDLGRKLGLTPTQQSDAGRNMIVNSQDEYIGLLVDRIADVVQAHWDEVEPPPANISGIQGRYFQGVFKTEKSLVNVLDVEEVLRDE